MDKTAFSCEEECRRKEQQELADKKNIIEKVIANVLNNDDEEGYSKIKQIAKESVKAVLAESKELISISFAALLQTLKTDPQMAKLIQNIASTNEGEQHDDNNIIKYLESNRNSLSDLAEKHNENLVEALTNNAVDNTGPNPTLSSSSSTFPSSFDQSHTYRREEPETYHNDNNDNKGDIADG